MIVYFYINLIILMLMSLLILVGAASVIVGLVMTRGVPFVSLPQTDWLKMCEVAELKPGQLVYDLGCGKANLLTTAAKNFRVKGIGYELSLWPYLWGKWRIWRTGTDVEILMQNFFKADLSKADIVFTYLFPEIMVRLEEKFLKELKPGTKVVSYAFTLPNVKPVKVVPANPRFTRFRYRPMHTSDIYVYQF